MAAVIMKKSDLDKMGKDLIKEIYDMYHDECYLKNFDCILKNQKKFIKNLVEIKYRESKYSCVSSGSSIMCQDKNKVGFNFEEELKCCILEINSKHFMDIDIIYKILSETSLNDEMELNEDLYYKHKAFLKIYDVYHNYINEMSD